MRPPTLLLLLLSIPGQTQGQSAADQIASVTVGLGKQTFVLLHGGPGFRHNYLRPEWDRLTNHGRVVYYDQRGCGQSTLLGPFGWEQHVADLASLLDGLLATDSVTLVGSSWGAYLALLFAYTHPSRVDRLILSGLPPLPAPGDMLVRMSPDQSISRNDSLAYLPMPSRRRTDSATVAHVARPEALASRLGPNCEDAATGAMHSLLRIPPIESLSQIRVPVLLLASTDETPQGDGSPAISALLPNAQRLVILNGGHDPWFTQPDSTFAVIGAFVSSR